MSLTTVKKYFFSLFFLIFFSSCPVSLWAKDFYISLWPAYRTLSSPWNEGWKNSAGGGMSVELLYSDFLTMEMGVSGAFHNRYGDRRDLPNTFFFGLFGKLNSNWYIQNVGISVGGGFTSHTVVFYFNEFSIGHNTSDSSISDDTEVGIIAGLSVEYPANAPLKAKFSYDREVMLAEPWHHSGVYRLGVCKKFNFNWFDY